LGFLYDVSFGCYVLCFDVPLQPYPFQVWRAELVLSDFVLHKMFTSSEFDGIVALELGAGTGTALIFMLLFTK
jgi:hypothetical protein